MGIVADSFLSKPGSLVLSMFPNILGFGIGVYALVFALSAKFVVEVQDTAEKQNAMSGTGKRTVLALNSDMSYPLIVLIFALAIGVVQQIFPANEWLIVGCWWAFWYGLFVTLEVVSTLFRLGEHSLLEKLESKQKN
ncbi:hypothetical protein [Paenacidovorax monticola]|uniref:Uncharacterized protein n=1 Tax=Paenacidovorax monticola TaxID=1926868 RepID=A0A7H0HG01_9BURK|nr:hypothetical protein [Paenacidovorax monticola]QNP59467.1 hypothetical protein H9L24_00010 [Paenacidovorax monticola]